MKSLRGRSLLLTFAAALLLAGALLTPTPALGTGFCRASDRFPATGQTTCYNTSGTVIPCAGTGQDGDIQAGATLRYRDKGNGTITDRNTRLIWEKKSDDGTIHDVDNMYTWAHAFALHVAGLNAMNFAGHSDWRLPNVKELQSIIDYETFNPAVDPAFNNNCLPACTVLTCSCTASSLVYWSSSTFASFPTSSAWFVGFFSGFVSIADKSFNSVNPHVRAVRGGCVD